MGLCGSRKQVEVVGGFVRVRAVPSETAKKKRKARRPRGTAHRVFGFIGVYEPPCLPAPPRTGPRLAPSTLSTPGMAPPPVMGMHGFHIHSLSMEMRHARVMRLRNEEGTLGDWDTVELIKHGALADIRLAQHARTGIFAVHKTYYTTPDHAKRALEEKRASEVLADGTCPFIADMYGTVRGDHEARFMYEFCQGGSLQEYYPRRRGVRASEDNVRMIAAQIAVALGHIHSKFFIYQALSYDHVVFDARGYLRLVGLSNCTQTAGPTGAAAPTSRQPRGVPSYYFAPEVLPSKTGGIAGGHTAAVDYWMLGCMIVDLVAGKGPFGDFDDPESLIEGRVRENRMFMPKHLSRAGQNIVRQLLTRDPDTRLNRLDAFKTHPWFDNFDWDALISFRAPVVVDPCVDHPADTSNFPPIPPPVLIEDASDGLVQVNVGAKASSGNDDTPKTENSRGGLPPGGPVPDADDSPLKTRASQVARGGLSLADGAAFLKSRSSQQVRLGEGGGWTLDLAKRKRAPDHEREHALGPHHTMTKEERDHARDIFREL